MRVTLVYPRFPDPENAYKVPPLGLAYLLAYLRAYFPYSLKLAVVDASAMNLGVEATFDHVKATEPNVLGISVMTPQADFAYALTKLTKEWDTRIVVVHGGAHVSALPQFSLQAGADY
ncbi:partial Anaerobic magnesium-protoporphyrin IX monomethyl ester cyclase, partial [Candidatus Brocadiaceae bacterium]